ncbi:MAG: ABC transporter permease [Gemmatimonadaceae bacterium]
MPIFRSLARAPGFSLAIIAMLATGSAALTITFALVDAALFRQPPFQRAGEIVLLNMTHTEQNGATRTSGFSWRRSRLLADRATSFESIANYTAPSLTLTGVGAPESIRGEFVSASYFRVLRAGVAIGRLFRADEDNAAGAHPIVVLGHDLWTSHFAGDPSIVGRDLRVNGSNLTVIGVAESGFRGVSGKAQYWIPSTMAPVLSYAGYLTTNQNFIGVVARLKTGVSVAAARAELALLGQQVDAEIPSDEENRGVMRSATVTSLNSARTDSATRRSVLILLGAVALLHLLACANAANLLLGRAATRRHEMAVRVALGASGVRLFGFAIAEGLILGLTSGVIGLAIAGWTSRVIDIPADLWGPRNAYGSIGRFDQPAFGFRVALFGVALTIVTTLLMSLIPAASTVRSDLLSNLRAGSRGVLQGAGLRRISLRGVVVAVEAGLAVLLLVCGGLMIASFARMRSTDLGVEPTHVLTFMARPSDVTVPAETAPAYLARLLTAVTQVPGVVSASVDGGAPMTGTARGVVHVVGEPVLPDDQSPPVNRHYIGPDHFTTLGMRLLDGRVFTDGDIAGRPRVAIASESAVRTFWPNESPIGKRVWFTRSSAWANADSSAEIVGVVNDVVHAPLDQQPNKVEFYTPYQQFTYSWRVFFVRTTGDPMATFPAVQRAIANAQPDLALTEVMPLSDVIGGSWARHRFDALLFGVFAAVALVLASAGIFAVVAYSVSMRTREMGIRLALGAQPREIVQLVVREGMTLPLLGLVGGIVAALAATRLLQASLYGITPTDPIVFVTSVVVLVAVSAAACLVPAWRATRVNPMDALRAE